MASSLLPVNLLVEGPTDEVVVRRVLEHVGLAYGTTYGKSGKPHILKVLPKYNQAARFFPWLVVVDLDRDNDCAPDFVRVHLPKPAEHMCFRVAVRAIEAWLMADREQLARFLHIPKTRLPTEPDAEEDPKRTLIDLARQSTRSSIREDIVPRSGSGTSIGPGYISRIIEFVEGTDIRWRPEIAAQHSDSLYRCINALESLKN